MLVLKLQDRDNVHFGDGADGADSEIGILFTFGEMGIMFRFEKIGIMFKT